MLMGMSRIYFKNGEYEESIEPLSELAELYEHKIKNYSVTGLNRLSKAYYRNLNGICLNMLSSAYYKLGKLEPALDYGLRALAMFESRKSQYIAVAKLSNCIGAIYSSLENPKKGLEYEFRALELLKTMPDTTITADIFNNIATAYMHLACYDEANDYLLRALRIYERTVGSNGAACCETLNNLSVLYSKLGNHTKSIEYLNRTLTIRKSTYGEDHHDNIPFYINIGIHYAELADYETALEYLFQALEFQEKAFGPADHPNYASCYDSIGGIYNHKGDYGKALKYITHALKIRENMLGAEHPDTAYEYESLGGVYSDIGNYDKASEYITHALMIKEKVLGTEHPDTANIYSKLGSLCGHMGNYADALVYSFHALRIREKVFGADHPDVALSYNEIGHVYGMLNNDEKRLEYESLALEIMKKTYSAEHPKIARSYNNIGATYSELGDFDQALEYQLQALNITEKALGTDHPMAAIVCHNIAFSYADLHEYEDAMQYELRAMEITEKTFGLEHTKAIMIFDLFGDIYYKTGELQKALECFLRILKIQKKSYSPNHPTFIDTYTQIALLYYELQDENTVNYTKKLMESIIQSNLSVFYIPQEELRLSLLNKRHMHVSLCFSVVFSSPVPFDANELYAFEVGTKNLFAESSFVQSNAANSDKNPEYAEKYSELRHLQGLYAKYSLEGFPEDQPREKLEQRILDSEYALAPYYREIDFKLHMQNTTTDNIQEQLSDDMALLEYGRYYYLSKEHCFQEQIDAGDRYFVFLVRRNDICLLELGACSEIDSLIEQVRTLLTTQADASEALHALYNILIAPVKNELSGVSQFYVAPDSELFKLPFELLQNAAGERLDQTIHSISYISTGRELLRASATASGSPVKNISIIADPEFNLNADKFVIPEDEKDEDHDISQQHSRDLDGHLKADSISNIPFTAVEADMIAVLFGESATVMRGHEAVKSAIRQIGSPHIIHLSTHGFAFASQDTDTQQKLHLFDRTDRGRRLKTSDNPMLRCGLTFAGICNWLKGENLTESIGNGILNGMDVLSLNLSNTDLMVLSACQTGLGDTQTGEGIQGLRRAFELAGVHTLICTLWKVDDLASAILMTAFYRNLLANKMNKAEALAAAKKYVKTLTPDQMKLDGWEARVDDLLTKGFEKEANRLQDALYVEPKITPDVEQEATPFAHPCFWAGFILQGEA